MHGLTILHVGAYNPRVHEASTSEPILPSALPRSPDDPLTAAAFDLMRVVHSMPRQMPPPPSPDRDLTLGQIRLLYLLRRKGPQPMGRIAEILDLSSTAASGFVTRVERHGFVERQHRSDDRRIVECVLTEAGSQFLDELTGVRIDAIRTALGRAHTPGAVRVPRPALKDRGAPGRTGMIALLRTYLRPYRAALALVVALLTVQALATFTFPRSTATSSTTAWPRATRPTSSRPAR